MGAGHRLSNSVRETLQAHPCALDSGHPWPPTFPDRATQPAPLTKCSLPRELRQLVSFCANRVLFLAASAYTDNCGFAPMLVGKMEASWMLRLGTWWCSPKPLTTESSGLLPMLQPPIWWAVNRRVRWGFMGSSAIAALASAQVLYQVESRCMARTASDRKSTRLNSSHVRSSY